MLKLEITDSNGKKESLLFDSYIGLVYYLVHKKEYKLELVWATADHQKEGGPCRLTPRL
jgi:hypothetical protein